MKALLYCTKRKPDLHIEKGNKTYVLNGKIVAECDFEVSEIELHQAYYNYGPAYFTKRKEPFKYFSYTDLLEASCLRDNEILKYLGNKGGYAIHIKNLHIFDIPRELSEYYHLEDKYILSAVKRAPQNMMYVYENPLCSSDEDRSVLISIHPEWLFIIISGKKTVEVRRKVLKGILENAKED